MTTSKNPMNFYKLLRSYLKEYLEVQRNHPETTIRSYKVSLDQYRLYLRDEQGIPFDEVDFTCFTRDKVYAFCTWLRKDQNKSINTINLRLTAIQQFLKYCGENDIEAMEFYLQVKQIRHFKSKDPQKIKYLTQEQLKILLAHPDLKTRNGRRNQYFMIHAYETGGRIEELLNMKLKDLIDGSSGLQVRLHGKGDKTRFVPFHEDVRPHLEAYLAEFHPDKDPEAYLFYTRHGGMATKMAPRTVNSFLAKYAAEIQEKDEDFPAALHCHMFRHSLGMGMFKSGIPLPYIKDYLGHASIDSTSIYAHTDSEMLKEALETVNQRNSSIPKQKARKNWKGNEEELLKFCGLK